MSIITSFHQNDGRNNNYPKKYYPGCHREAEHTDGNYQIHTVHTPYSAKKKTWRKRTNRRTDNTQTVEKERNY